MHLFVLSQENIELSRYEAASLLNIRKYTSIKNLMIMDNIDKNKIKRLAYTKKIYEILFETSEKNIINKISSYSWNKIYKKNFCVRIYNSNPEKEKEFAKYIWRNLTERKIKPKVNLENPKTMIEFFYIPKKVLACRLIYENKENFEKRKMHLLPRMHPTAMHPKLARCLINIANENEILDPFCGAGGILIEAGLLKLKIAGSDIDKKMIERAKANLKKYRIKTKLEVKDALKLNKSMKAIVTDLPYGLNSKISIKNLENLYFKFLKNARKTTKKIIIVFPDFIKYKKLIKTAGFKIEKEFSSYVHKNLTRKIIILKL